MACADVIQNGKAKAVPKVGSASGSFFVIIVVRSCVCYVYSKLCCGGLQWSWPVCQRSLLVPRWVEGQ